jgi:DNA/RNA endonuclease G (NUC1)
MSKSILTGMVMALFWGIFQAHATIDAALQMQLGNPSGAIADTNNHSHFLIQRTVEALDYNDTYGEPNWASWDLTAGDVGNSGRSTKFFQDTNLPPNFHEVGPNDYSGSAYDRGHMCPSDDRTDTTNDNNLVFLMSNMVPQNGDVNSGVWGDLEGYCRFLAQTNNDELLITCGPGGFTGSRINTNGYVWIPQYCWKIIVVVPPGSGTALSRITNATRVIAVEIPNTNVVNTVWQNFVTSVNQIQLDTGYTFFTALPTNVAAALRSKVDGQISGLLAGWDVSTCTGFGVSPLPATTNAANVTVSGLTRGSGVVTGSGGLSSGGWGGTGFTAANEAAAVTANDFITFSLMASNGYNVSFTDISEFDYRRSGTGPTNGVLQYQIGSAAFIDITNLTYSSSSSSGAMLGSIDLSGVAALQNVGANTNVTFRIVNYGGKSTGTWYVYDYLGNSLPDFEIQGTVAQVIYPPAAIPVISAVTWTNQQFGFTVSGTAGSNYVIEAATDLTTPDWIPLTTNAAPFVFTETNRFNQRFYRALTQ